MSLSSWLRNGTGDEERRLLQLQDAEDVDHLYAQWREDRVADYAPLAPVVPITAARTVEQASGLSGAGRPSGAPGHYSAPSTPAEPHRHFKNAAEPVTPDPAA